MKICYVFLFCCLFIAISPSISLGEGTLHTFTTLDGRALKAKITDYNERTKKIQLEREDGKLVSTLPTVFSEPDQEYIQQWIAADQFMSPTKFRIKADSTETEISKNKTEVVYEITLENKTDFPLTDLKIEYRAFILSQGYEHRKDSNRVSGDQLHIAEILAGGQVSKKAQPISLISQFTRVSESSRWGGSTTYEKKTMRENLKGFWIKVYGPENDGTPTIREWYYPSDTSEDFSWTDKITRAPEIKPNWAWTPERPADTHDYSNKELTLLRKVSSCQRTAPEKALKLAHECYEIAQAPRAAQMLGHLYIYKLRNIPLGLEWLEKAANGNDFNACIALVRRYAIDGAPKDKYRNITKAIKYGQQAISIRPQDFYAHRILATACAQDGYFEKAVKHQSLAITLYREGDSQSSSYLYQMETTLELYHDHKVAQAPKKPITKENALLKEVSDLWKSDPQKALELAHEVYKTAQSPAAAKLLGQLYLYILKPANVPLGLEWLEKAAQKNHYMACYLLATFYATYEDAQYHDTAKALKYASQAVSINDGWHAQNLLAKVYAHTDQFTKAIKHQKTAIKEYEKGEHAKPESLAKMKQTLTLYQNYKTE